MTEDIKAFRNEHFFLSNFYLSDITVSMDLAIDGVDGEYLFVLPSGEHCFQSMKVAASAMNDAQKFEWMTKMAAAPTPGQSKYLGRSINIDIQKWNAMAYRCMQRTQELKYTQNLELAKLLMDTGDAKLIEGNFWGDQLWGVDDKGMGKNQLGIILMELRENLRKY